MHQQRQAAGVDQQQLPAPPHAFDLRPLERAIGGSNVFSTLTPGATADSIVSPVSASSSRRAVISISGSSGIAHRR